RPLPRARDAAAADRVVSARRAEPTTASGGGAGGDGPDRRRDRARPRRSSSHGQGASEGGLPKARHREPLRAHPRDERGVGRWYGLSRRAHVEGSVSFRTATGVAVSLWPRGRGIPVLFVPGLFGRRRQWVDAVAALEPARPCAALDLP